MDRMEATTQVCIISDFATAILTLQVNEECWSQCIILSNDWGLDLMAMEPVAWIEGPISLTISQSMEIYLCS